MKVAIVGAGISGLAAARELVSSGHEAVLFERKATVGGRIQTTTIGDFTFDPGATTIMPMGKALEHVILKELPTDDLVEIKLPVMSHDGFRISSGGLTATKTPRYCYKQGIFELARLLSVGLDIRLETRIDKIEPKDMGFIVNGEGFDAAILTMPCPVADKLLGQSGENRRFSNSRFRSCLSIMLGFAFAFEAHYHALIGPDQIHPLGWLSFETLKCPGSRAPEGHTAVVAQMGAEYSKRRFDVDDDLILEETLGDIARLLGKDFAGPVVSSVKRFKYSHPETTASFEAVNSPMSRLVVAGDGLMGGRLEMAYDTGIRAAKMLMENA